MRVFLYAGGLAVLGAIFAGRQRAGGGPPKVGWRKGPPDPPTPRDFSARQTEKMRRVIEANDPDPKPRDPT